MKNGCEAGCKVFTGGEIKHHKDCQYYPESLSKMYDDLESKYRDLMRDNNSLNEKIQEKTNLLMQLRIDLVAEMKMAKMMFEMVLSDGHTHRAKEWIAKLSNHVLDLNINKAEQAIMKKIDYDNGLPF